MHDSNKVDFHARHLNSNTDQSSESSPVELLTIDPATAKKIKSAIDLFTLLQKLH